MTFMHTRAERKELPGEQPARGAAARFGGPYLCTRVQNIQNATGLPHLRQPCFERGKCKSC